MLFPKWRRVLAPLFLSLLLLISSCALKPPSPYAQAQQESTQRGAQPAIVKNAEQGSSFNRFFPKPGNGYERVFTQEKKGFAEAKLKKEGKDLAMLAISDTISLPSASQKFQTSSQKISGYPAVEVGNTQTAVLVANRYQVKVLSRNPAFTQNDRQAWIQKFDLNGLSRLK
ncbi:MAG: hypothetical protein KME16_08340 [Scytolyngbya sp. HA4215-MV1]|jgi:hypothetical protein|nr:hypothetical protein [Scytolyngbya sp. HA4215-MV1]